MHRALIIQVSYSGQENLLVSTEFFFEMRFLFFILLLCFSLPQHLLAASLNSSKSSERTTNEGYTFNNVYNSGLSTSQAQEIIKRMRVVEQKLDEIEWKGPTKGNFFSISSVYLLSGKYTTEIVQVLLRLQAFEKSCALPSSF